jgi:hypothetical protein
MSCTTGMLVQKHGKTARKGIAFVHKNKNILSFSAKFPRISTKEMNFCMFFYFCFYFILLRTGTRLKINKEDTGSI